MTKIITRTLQKQLLGFLYF